jgi:hypothetical protein
VWGVEPLCEGNPRLLWGHRRGRGALPSTDAKQPSWVSFTQCPQTSQKNSTPSMSSNHVGYGSLLPEGCELWASNWFRVTHSGPHNLVDMGLTGQATQRPTKPNSCDDPRSSKTWKARSFSVTSVDDGSRQLLLSLARPYAPKRVAMSNPNELIVPPNILLT